jgi:hypothetical protein
VRPDPPAGKRMASVWQTEGQVAAARLPSTVVTRRTTGQRPSAGWAPRPARFALYRVAPPDAGSGDRRCKSARPRGRTGAARRRLRALIPGWGIGWWSGALRVQMCRMSESHSIGYLSAAASSLDRTANKEQWRFSHTLSLLSKKGCDRNIENQGV